MTDFLASPSEQPLSYYEEKSYMLAIPWSDQEDTLFDREEKDQAHQPDGGSRSIVRGFRERR